jgi:hypothetical protein
MKNLFFSIALALGVASPALAQPYEYCTDTETNYRYDVYEVYEFHDDFPTPVDFDNLDDLPLTLGTALGGSIYRFDTGEFDVLRYGEPVIVTAMWLDSKCELNLMVYSDRLEALGSVYSDLVRY